MNLLGPLGGLLYGAASAFVPVVNAEVYAVASAGRSHVSSVVIIILALSVGQTCGKLIIFEAARRGSQRFSRKRPAPRWAARIQSMLSRRRSAAPLVLASALTGLPPLAAISFAAGASGQRRRDFGIACLVGRTARFLLIALPVAWTAL